VSLACEDGHRVILQQTVQSLAKEIIAMSANPRSIDLSTFVAEHLERTEPALLGSMLSSFIQALISLEADALCGAPYGDRALERTNCQTDTGPGISTLGPAR
jgi:hypothetical protein